MKALQYNRPGGLDMVDLALPVAGKGEVLVKVAYAGICGTDIHILAEEAPSADLVVLGHEFSGSVVAVGEGVSNVREGQFVAVDPNNYCGWCPSCRKGQVHFCENLSPLGVQRNGAWAQHCLTPAAQVYPLLPGVPPEWGALGEPLSCILHGCDRIQPLPSPASILIVGGGIVGLLWALLLKAHGHRHLIISEPNEGRRTIAENLNLKTVDPIRSNGRSALQEHKFNLVIDCSGNPEAIRQAFYRLDNDGKLLLFGVCPEQSELRLNPFDIFKKEITILGSVINPFTFGRAMDTIPAFMVPASQLGIRFYELEDYQKAIVDVKSGKVTKAMFRPNKM